MKTTTNPSRTKALSLLMAAVVVLSATAGLAGLASAATTTDLNVSITDDDDTIAPGETTTVEVAVASADGGVGAAELGVTSSDPGVAAITDVSVLHGPGSTNNTVAGGGQSADVKYAFANSPDTGSVTIVEVTLQAAAEGSTTIDVVQNGQTGNLVVFDENGAGYTLDTVGSATLTVEEVNQPPTADAGDDQTVTAGDTVTLDGSDSSDPNPDDTLGYAWTETTSSGVPLSDASAAQPTFTAPDVDSETTLEFQIEVTDDEDASGTDSVSVTIQPPDAASFQVSNLQAPSSAQQGDAIDVSATVENTGGQTATKAVEFRVDTDGDDSIGDESAVASQNVELDSEESTTVTFEDVPTSGLAVGTLTHGVATEDDSATAQIEITAQPAPPAGETTVSLEPADQTSAIGLTTTYDVVVDNAAGGVGAAEIRVTVDDANVATITGASLTDADAIEDVEVADDGTFVDLEYAFADTADTGSVTVATVTVEGADEGATSLSVGSTDGNGDVLVFDEDGDGYDVVGTNGATLEVLPVQFLVDTTNAPEKAATGSTVTVAATVSSDGVVESTQPVSLLFDVDGDGTPEPIATKTVTIGPNGQTQVSFDVQVPADASFGDRAYSVETIADSADGTVGFTPPAVNEEQDLPGDPDGDGLFQDVNGDGDVDAGDAQSLFANRDASAVQNNAAAFDFNGDGVVNVGDAQALFDLVTEG
jgi:hypothetical protein